MSDQAKRMQILRAVALRVDGFYDDAARLAQAAVTAKTKRAQISGLEAIANSAIKTTDVFNYVKLRIGRHDEWRKESWGDDLLNYLTRTLRQERRQICETLNFELDSAAGQQVHLLLMREFVHQFAVHYEYISGKAGGAS